jgi:hypothetical protein
MGSSHSHTSSPLRFLNGIFPRGRPNDPRVGSAAPIPGLDREPLDLSERTNV